ncbi:MAG: hypothetical protein, partial [Olavius algarvensis Gamma 1 endosymbiont]
GALQQAFRPNRKTIQRWIYSSNINISFFHSADEFEIVRQQRTQFAL